MYRLAICVLCYLAVVGCLSPSIPDLGKLTKKVLGGNDTNPSSFRSKNDQGQNDPDELMARLGHETATKGEGDGQSSGLRENMTERSDEKNSEKQDFRRLKIEENLKQVCYRALGCFSLSEPWTSTLRPVGEPDTPEEIDAVINHYSRDNLFKPQNITLYPEIDMGEADFEPSRPTAIMVHGFCSSGSSEWLRDLKDAYLKKYDANVMIVDWGSGAAKRNYLRVAANIRVVAREVALLLKYLIAERQADVRKFHLIGHSLGAQICSYIAKETPGITHLTGLDPAQPAFEGFDQRVRLDISDAEFVEVVHTDARPLLPTLGFGMISPHGHIDFYPNGGFDQPGCVINPIIKNLAITNLTSLARYPVEVINDIVSCPHSRSYLYLIEAYQGKCTFWAQKAGIKNILMGNANALTQGLLGKFVSSGSECTEKTCVRFGFDSIKSPLRGVFVFNTNSNPPYCRSRIRREIFGFDFDSIF